MLDESGGKSPHEPDDPEPEDLEPEEFDPESLGPESPSIPDLSEKASEADPEVSGLFWWLVVVFNVALMAFSLGLMFIIFQQNWTLGGQLSLAGLVLGGYGYVRYRRFKRS